LARNPSWPGSDENGQKRTVPGAEQKLIKDLQWAGLQWDEGEQATKLIFLTAPLTERTIGPEVGGPYGPYRQSERTNLPLVGNIYKNHAEKLLDSGHAYRCFCSAALLHQKATARASLREPTDYDGTCSHIPKETSDARAQTGESFVIRLNDKKSGELPSWKDLVFGQVHRKTARGRQSLRGDIILLKADGWPTYHLASVVDDHDMKITHVIRGAEWLDSTWKHLALYRAFGWTAPEYAHVGLLLDNDRSKLSKRDTAFDLDELKKEFLPETLMNFLVLLGWSHKQQSEFFTMGLMEEQVRAQAPPTSASRY
jgi:glutamyl-tRNA synthetase